MKGFVIMKRAEAASLGMKKYKPDYPCRRGHTSPRYTSTGNCIECLKETRKALVVDMNAAQMARAYGLVRFSADVRPQDVAMLTDLIESLKLAGPPELIAADGMPETPSASIDVRRLVYSPSEMATLESMPPVEIPEEAYNRQIRTGRNWKSE